MRYCPDPYRARDFCPLIGDNKVLRNWLEWLIFNTNYGSVRLYGVTSP
jgi:hypothetical protein